MNDYVNSKLLMFKLSTESCLMKSLQSSRLNFLAYCKLFNYPSSWQKFIPGFWRLSLSVASVEKGFYDSISKFMLKAI